MKIRKGGISRNIDKKRFNEYKAKGYEVVVENKELSEDKETALGDENIEVEISDKSEEAETSEAIETNKAVEDKKEYETDEIEKMTIAELKVYAENNNIDLGDATKKADILKAITGRVW
jgi:hypothetical protein